MKEHTRGAAVLLALALTAAAGRAQDSASADPVERARAYVSIALSSGPDQPVLLNGLDDKEPAARLAASIAVCHSPAVSESLYIYALGNVHTSIRPQITNSHATDNWVFAPDAALQAMARTLPIELPSGALGRLKGSAVSTNILQRDPAHFLLAEDARRSPQLAREVDALIFDASVHPAIRGELAAACAARLGAAAVPVLADAIASGQAFSLALEAGLTHVALARGGPRALVRQLADPRPGVATACAGGLASARFRSAECAAALQEAARLDLPPEVRAQLH